MIDAEQYWTEIIAKSLSGNATADEEQRLRNWRGARFEHEEFFKEHMQVWNLSGYETTASAAGDWNGLLGRLSKQEPSQSTKRGATRHVYRWLAAAAAVGILIVLGRYNDIFDAKTDNFQAEVIQAATTDDVFINLPDGSMVWLRSGSEVTYHKTFVPREVRLNGEAFFEVIHDSDRLFRVIAGDAVVTVLGTKFNVRSASTGEVDVYVAEGKVEVSLAKSQRQGTILTAGSAATYHREQQNLEIAPQLTSNILSWRTGALSFDHAPVEMVLRDLDRHFNVSFNLANGAMQGCELKANFNNSSIEDVINTIVFTLKCEITERDGTYYVSGPSCSTSDIE